MTLMSHDLTKPRYLEDFSIGEIIETGEAVVTREMILSFAELYDPQPMHLDDEAAKATVFGELVASGWQTLALTMRLLVDARLLGSTPIVGADFKDMRFHAPLRPGESIWAQAQILGSQVSKSKPERGFLEMKVTTLGGRSSPIVTQTWRLVVPTRVPHEPTMPASQ